jgi:Zn ribbon nucleic-acid-binding protein
MMRAGITTVLGIHRIVGRASMTSPETTTITHNMRCDFVNDVSCKNTVLSIAITPALRLSAVVWTTPVTDTVVNARVHCLKLALGVLAARLSNEEAWLIAAHSAPQPDNRITRHNGLWKSLKKAGVVIPQGDFLDECVLKSESTIRVFGAVRCGWNQSEAINSVMKEAQAALVVIPGAKADETVKLLVQRGWAMWNSKPPKEVLEVACAKGGVVVEVYGAFDDPEVSVAAIGRQELLRELNLVGISE